MAFSPDGRFALTHVQHQARLWDTSSGKPVGPPMAIRNRGRINAYGTAFNKDGRRALTGNRLWNLPSVLPTEVERLSWMLTAATGLELDEHRAVRVLDREELLQALQRSDQQPNAWPSDAFTDEKAWHENRAADAAEAGDLFSTRWHLDKLARAKEPDSTFVEGLLIGMIKRQRRSNQPGLAIPVYEELLRWQSRLLGPDHDLTSSTVHDLGWFLRELGRHDEAVPYFRRILDRSRAKLPEMHPMRIDAENHLGWTLVLAGKYAEAAPHLLDSLRALRALKQIPPNWLASYLDRVATLYERWGKPAPGIRWRLEQIAALPVGPPRENLLNATVQAARIHLSTCEQKSPRDWTLPQARALLGGCLLARKKHAEAELYLLHGLEGLTRLADTIPQDSQWCVPLTRQWLADLRQARIGR